MPAAPSIVDVTYAADDTPADAAPSAGFGSPVAAAASPPAKRKTRLYVATPCYGCMMTTTYLLSLLELQAECVKRGIECFIDFIGNESLVQRARNVFVGRFLKGTSSHLLFIDADIGFRPDAVFRLLDAGKDIATVVYPKKSYDWDAVATKLADPPATTHREPVHMLGLDYNINLVGQSAQVENGFVRVLDAATGFMLITRETLERMADRYRDELTCVNDLPGNRDDPGYVTEYVAVFDCMIDPETRRYLSEDYSFNRRAQAMGIETWVDLASPLCHVGNYVFEGDLRQRFSMVYAG